MINFIKEYNVKNIRRKLTILYFLNVSDILFTLALLRTGLFRETNILMAEVVKSPIISIILKVIFPAVLLYFLYKKIRHMDYDELKAANIGLIISLTVYLLVNLSHIIWVAMLPLLLHKI